MITRKTRFWQFSICLSVLILLASCEEPPGIPEADFEESYTPGEISETLTVRIYFDATVSMKGFAVVPGATHYAQMLPCLERAVQKGWIDEKIEFFRFGTQVEPIDRSAYQRAAHPGFYDDETINQKTHIEKVIDYEVQKISDLGDLNANRDEANTDHDEADTDRDEENSLAVIVTDLFQEKSDINQPFDQLKEKYLRKNLAVGLLGLRSQFDGIIYDAGFDVAPMPYKSDMDNPETFRPFYLLVLGRHTDIAHYFNQLIASGFPEAKTVLFSQYLVNSLVAPEGASIEPIGRNLRKSESLVRPPDARLKQFRIQKGREPAKFSATLKYITLPYTLSFASDQLEVSVIAKHVRGKREGQTVENPTARKCLEVTSTFSENELTVEGTLTPNLKKGVYLYEFTLTLKGDYQIPAWCLDWDMGLERDGSKTLNLGSFVRDLAHVTAQMHQPKIAKFHCYIQKK